MSSINKFFAAALFSVFLLPSLSYAVCEVTLDWDDNAIPPDGYRLFVRENNQTGYSTMKWQGADSQATITGLEEGKTYFTVVRAYSGGLESDNSNEVSYSFDDSCAVTTHGFPWILVIPSLGKKEL